MRLSIRWKLMLFICGPLIVINGALLAWDYAHQKSAAIEQMADLISEKARISADQLGARLEAIVQIADSDAAALAARGAMSDTQVRAAAVDSLRRSALIAGCAIVMEPGVEGAPRTGTLARRMTGNIRQLPLADLTVPGEPEPEWFAAKGGQKAGWSVGALGNQASHVPVYWYAAVFPDRDNVRGVIAVAIRAQGLQTIMGPRARAAVAQAGERIRGRGGVTRLRNGAAEAPTESATAEEPETPQPSAPWTLASQFGPDGFVIVDRQQRIVSHSDAAKIGKPWLNLEAARDAKSMADAWQEMLVQGHGALQVNYLSDEVAGIRADSAHWIAFAQIPAARWIFATAIPESLVIAPIVEQLRSRAVFLVAGVAGIALIIMLVSIRMSRPIEGLAHAVERLAGGDLESRVEGVRSHDELGTLAVGFNSMVGKLKEQIAAVARETAAREGIESELRIARQIQQDLLPHATAEFVGRADFDLHAINIPARRVAGDFYDYFFVGDKLVVVIADVSGKGMPAALLMAVARTVVRDFASLRLTPAQIAVHANQTLFEGSDDSMFVTMFLAEYEPATGKLTYVCAGHPPPYVLSMHSAARLGDPTAPLMGVFAGPETDGAIEQESRTLQPGETLFLYTDGVTEARSPSGRMVGEEGLVQAFAKLGTCDAHSLCERVLAGVQAYERGGQADDITMLALRRTK